MKRACIYALCDPQGEVRYVGQTTSPGRRYRQHCRLSNNHARTHRCAWLTSTLKTGDRPEMVILERCWDPDWREESWINHYTDCGARLTNGAAGRLDLSAAHGARKAMPWAGRQAPMQKALIAMRSTIKFLRGQGRTEAADRIERKADAAQSAVNRLKRDREAYIRANERFGAQYPSVAL